LQHRATVEGADARAAAAKGLIASGIGSAREVDDVTRAFRERGVMQHGAPTALSWGHVQGKNGRERVGITTALHEREERGLIARASTAAADKTAALAPAEIAAAVARFPDLDYASEHGQAQRTVMERLGTGGRLGVAIGVAGSGKTTLLKPLVAAWQEAGREVHGIALAWRQSNDLVDAGIAASNTRAVENFLRAVAKSRITLDETSVVVVDELGLLGTRQLNTRLQAQATHGFQIVALGDPKQMQSVDAGAVIILLRQALGEEAIPTLATSVRQVDARSGRPCSCSATARRRRPCAGRPRTVPSWPSPVAMAKPSPPLSGFGRSVAPPMPAGRAIRSPSARRPTMTPIRSVSPFANGGAN
jgi:hypothetical protein